MIKERYLYKIFPIRREINYTKLPFEVRVIGFWGFIFRLFKIDTFGKVYRYYGSYWEGIASQYLFNKRKNRENFSMTIKTDNNWQVYQDLKRWIKE